MPQGESFEALMQRMTGKPSQQQQAATPPPEGTDLGQRVKQLEGLLQQQGSSQEVFKGLLSDPDVAALLAAKQQGRKVKIIPLSQGQEQQATDAEGQTDELTDLSDLTPAQMIAKVEARSQQKMQRMIEQTLDPVLRNVQLLNQVVQREQQGQYTKQIEEARKRFGEESFDSLRPQMIELAKQNPGLTADQLYVVTKMQMGAADPNRQRRVLDTERPNGAASRPAETQQQTRPVENQGPRPPRSMLTALSEAGTRAGLDTLELEEPEV